MSENNIRNYVLSLSGYLHALRDMNDMHDGTRYYFGADMIFLEDKSVESTIHEYYKNDNISIHIKEINLSEELAIIESYILDNYMLGTSNPESEEQNYIKHLHGWRIQDYISLAANYEDEDGRWAVEIEDGKRKQTNIFVKIKNNLVIMAFFREKTN